ncbi:MAG: glycoside hydrolase family 2 TIM barrel-domain containing protein [Armatimonadota bacterium]
MFTAAILSLAFQPSKVAIVPKGKGYQLTVNGKPFFVKGAGAPVERFAGLSQYGANSVRTWGVDEKTGPLLDEAQKQGLKVCVGFWMRKEDGFSYRKPEDLKAQMEDFRKWVKTYKNHPALLMWAVGNEVELGGEWPECFIQSEELAKVVKSEDTNHPVISVVADMWPEKQAMIEKYWKSLDAIGVNSYQGLPTLSKRMEFWKKPYFITEWQFSLPDKDEKNPWAGFVEPSSDAKNASVIKNYKEVILKQPGRVLGSYFFYWSKSKTGIASLHAPFLSNEKWQPMVRTMAQFWGGKVPMNRPPSVRIVEPKEVFKVKPGQEFDLDVVASDPDNEALVTQFEIIPNDPKKRFVGDFEKDLGIVGRGDLKGKTRIKAPTEPGLYRVAVYTYDPRSAASVDSRSFLVE